MGLLDRLLGGGDAEDHAERALEARRDTDLERLAAGSVPHAAEQRLRELAGGVTAFTSNLSVADYALSSLDEVRPIAQVMGSSVYKVGWQTYPWGSSWNQGAQTVELDKLSAAWNEARRLALSRLDEEARLAGCHAVVDVTFQTNRHEFLSGDIEIVLTGTAVHLPEGDGGGPPILTDLSMPDYTLLRRAGYAPVGVVSATAVYYVVASWQTQRLTSGWQRFQPNQELPDFTQGVYTARETALARATRQARELGANGMVGMTIDHQVETREVDNGGKREDLIITFHVVGTAIMQPAEHRPLDPQTIVRQNRSST
jgi:uncharacterized protein YbjQ (UPF0145 family)